MTACEIDGSGKLSVLNRVESGGAGPCHLGVEATGEYVLVADYADGLVSMLPIGADGRVGEPSHVVDREGSSVDPDRQTGPHVHSVTPGPANEVVYVADLGTDELVVYDMDLGAGRLEAEQVLAVRDGAGPRHVAVHPSGNYLYVSNRGHHSVAVFELDGTGEPVPAGHVPTGGEWPRNVAIDPAGRFLFAENEHTDDVHAFDIDGETGDLDATGDVIEVPKPVCMTFRE